MPKSRIIDMMAGWDDHPRQNAIMARRTRRELDIADHLWDCLTRIAEDCGTDRHAVVNQAIYEFARRFNFLTPMAKEVPIPEEIVGPGKQARAGGGVDPAPAKVGKSVAGGNGSAMERQAPAPKPAPGGGGAAKVSPQRK